MREKKWLDLRRKVLGRDTDRKKVEHALAEYYKYKGWPKFDYIIYDQDLSAYTRRGTSGHWGHHSLTDYRLKYLVGNTRDALDFTVVRPPGASDPWTAILGNLRVMHGQPKRGMVSDLMTPLLEEVLDFTPFYAAPHVLEKPAEAHFDVEGRFHCEDGPAILWKSGTRSYFWNGVSCSRRFIEEEPTVSYINRQWNQERKRVLLERFGQGRWLKAMNAKCIAEDEYGKLWEIHRSTVNRLVWDWDQHHHVKRLHNTGIEDIKYVEVVNGSPEPDGSYRTFFLRVPPHCQTPHEGVSWTYGETVDTYKIKART